MWSWEGEKVSPNGPRDAECTSVTTCRYREGAWEGGALLCHGECELGKTHPRDSLEDCWKPRLGLEDKIEAHGKRSLQ